MKKYIAKLVFEIKNHSMVSQFDEQLRLIEADSEEEALTKSLELGRLEEDDFLTSDNKKVGWKFIALAGLFSLGDFEHGSEICSVITEHEHGHNYIHYLRVKQEALLQQLSVTV